MTITHLVTLFLVLLVLLLQVVLLKLKVDERRESCDMHKQIMILIEITKSIANHSAIATKGTREAIEKLLPRAIKRIEDVAKKLPPDVVKAIVTEQETGSNILGRRE